MKCPVRNEDKQRMITSLHVKAAGGFKARENVISH